MGKTAKPALVGEDEGLYRSLPEPAIELALEDPDVQAPNAIVESVEASIGIPVFAEGDFADLRVRMRGISSKATTELQELLNNTYYPRNGHNGVNGTNGHSHSTVNGHTPVNGKPIDPSTSEDDPTDPDTQQ